MILNTLSCAQVVPVEAQNAERQVSPADLLSLGPVEGPAGDSVVTRSLTRTLPPGAAMGGNARRQFLRAGGQIHSGRSAAQGPTAASAQPGLPAGAAAPAPALPEGFSRSG